MSLTGELGTKSLPSAAWPLSLLLFGVCPLAESCILSMLFCTPSFTGAVLVSGGWVVGCVAVCEGVGISNPGAQN